jgi:(p)ppGpp synthase/HD superfamily hydrolase
MIYTALTGKAMKLAYDAHHGQVDHGGIPYIFHPIHLAEQMTDEVETCVALLHDVVEDTAVTLEDLQKEFPPEIAEPVRLLTHTDSVDYFDYVRALKESDVARRVKLADLRHNSDETRLADVPMTEEKRAFWKAKYQRAREILEAVDAVPLSGALGGKWEEAE